MVREQADELLADRPGRAKDADVDSLCHIKYRTCRVPNAECRK